MNNRIPNSFYASLPGRYYDDGGSLETPPNNPPVKRGVNETTAMIYSLVSNEIEKAKTDGRLQPGQNLNVEGIVAQILHESGNGQSDLTRLYNNFGGIKADKNWKGEKVNVGGTEWRKYSSPEEGIQEQINFFINNERYKNHGVFNATTPEEHLKAVQAAGYAGDPNKEGKNYVNAIMPMVNSIPKRLAKVDPTLLKAKEETATVTQAPVQNTIPETIPQLPTRSLQERPLITGSSQADFIPNASDPNKMPNIQSMQMSAPKGWFGSGKSIFNNGGPMEQLTQFNNGGTHEQNPLGGIPQGINSNGQPNLVEQGETKLDSKNYIYSDSLKIDAETADMLKLSKSDIGKTFADVSKKMNRPDSRRENDTIEEEAKKRDLEALMHAQEAFKQKEVQRKIDEINALDPTALAPQQAPQPQMPVDQGQMMDPSMMQIPPGMRLGGNMYDFGGSIGAGVAGVASGIAGSLLPGPLGTAATKGIDTIHNALDKNITEQERAIAGFGKAAGAIGTGIITGGASLATGANDIASGIGQGVSNLNGVDPKTGQMIKSISNVASAIPFNNGGYMYPNGGVLGDPPVSSSTPNTNPLPFTQKSYYSDALKKEVPYKDLPYRDQVIVNRNAGFTVGIDAAGNKVYTPANPAELGWSLDPEQGSIEGNQTDVVMYNGKYGSTGEGTGTYQAGQKWTKVRHPDTGKYVMTFPTGKAYEPYSFGDEGLKRSVVVGPDYSIKSVGEGYTGTWQPMPMTPVEVAPKMRNGGELPKNQQAARALFPNKYGDKNYFETHPGGEGEVIGERGLLDSWKLAADRNRMIRNNETSTNFAGEVTNWGEYQKFRPNAFMYKGLEGPVSFSNGGPMTEEEYKAQQTSQGPFSENFPSPYVGEMGLTNSSQYNPNAGYVVNRASDNQFTEFNEKTDPSKSDFTYNQSLGNFALGALPVAYNLYQGVFGKVGDIPSADDLYTSVNAPEMNINPQLRQTDQTFAQAQSATRNAAPGAGSYLSNMQQQANMRNQNYSQLYGQKENTDAQNQMRADMFNAQNKGQATLQAYDLQAKAQAAKQNYLQTGLSQLNQIGQSQQGNELAGIYNNMAAPDFNFSYNPFLKRISKNNNNKNNDKTV